MRHFATLLTLMLSVSCGRNLEQQIQQQVASFGNASLGEDQVQVTDIRTTGNQAVAEIQVKTGVKLIKRGGQWEIDEIRLGIASGRRPPTSSNWLTGSGVRRP